MRSFNEKLARLVQPVAIGAGCMYMLLSVMNTGGSATPLTPQVGDILAFQPTAEVIADRGIRLTAHRPGQADCVLELTTLHRTGGSLVIERQVAEPAGRFLAHWAGERTADDGADCGRTSDLILAARDLHTVSLSAAGLSEAALPARDRFAMPGYTQILK